MSYRDTVGPMPVFDPPPAPVMSAMPAPTTAVQRSKNPLRPNTLDEVIGQTRTVALLRRILGAVTARDAVLDHTLLLGASGTGKTTLAHVIANELGVGVYPVEAPISHETLLDLREVMDRGDVLFIDEIHQQAIAERRGRSTSTQPEVLFGVMEDRTLVSGYGVLPFPEIVVMGATTDEGMLPDAFVNRFPLRPVLDGYTEDDLVKIAKANADALGLVLLDASALIFAKAARGVPRHINNYLKNAAMLTAGVVDTALAEEVLADLNRVTEDGLSLDMQKTLTFLFTRGRRKGPTGVTYQASVSTIATAIGKSRDTKAVTLRVEPYLIEQGYLQVGHGGRSLTPAGVKRAKELLP